jgi:hypothetical protein
MTHRLVVWNFLGENECSCRSLLLSPTQRLAMFSSSALSLETIKRSRWMVRDYLLIEDAQLVSMMA